MKLTMNDGTTSLKDEAKGMLDGHKFRAICAANRRKGTRFTAIVGALPPAPITSGQDRYGEFLRFEVLDGDLSANERRDYRNRLPEASERAMLAFEGDGSKDRIGKAVGMRFKLVLEPGAPVRNPNFFCVLAQWNSYPDDRVSFHPPPGEFGLTYRERKTRRASDGREIVARDALGAPIVEECFYWRIHARGADGKPKKVFEARSQPIRRDRLYEIGLELLVTGGVDGGAGSLTLDGVLQGDTYRGPAGFPENSGPYAAIGVYRLWANNGPLAARFYDWSEGLSDG